VDGDSRWCCTYLLNPSDPLFIEIGEAFIKQQTEGTLKLFLFFNLGKLCDPLKAFSQIRYILTKLPPDHSLFDIITRLYVFDFTLLLSQNMERLQTYITGNYLQFALKR